MKKLVCELCGSTDLIKRDGVYVCESCGGKYSVEEAKKMMVEGVVEVKGAVQIDDSNRLESYYVQANVNLEAGRIEEASDYCDKILENNVRDARAWLLKGKINEDTAFFKKALEYAQDKKDMEKEIADWCTKQVTDGLTKYKFPQSLDIIRKKHNLWCDIRTIIPENLIDIDAIREATTKFFKYDLRTSKAVFLHKNIGVGFDLYEEENFKNIMDLIFVFKDENMITDEGYDYLAKDFCNFISNTLTKIEDQFIKDKYQKHGQTEVWAKNSFQKVWQYSMFAFDQVYQKSSVPELKQVCQFMCDKQEFFLDIEWKDGRDEYSFSDDYKREQRAKLAEYKAVLFGNEKNSAENGTAAPTVAQPEDDKLHQVCASCGKEFSYQKTDEIYDDEKGTVVCPHCGAINGQTQNIKEEDEDDEGDDDTDETENEDGAENTDGEQNTDGDSDSDNTSTNEIIKNLSIFWIVAIGVLFGILITDNNDFSPSDIEIVKDIKRNSEAKSDKAEKLRTMKESSFTIETSAKMYEQNDDIKLTAQWYDSSYVDEPNDVKHMTEEEIEYYCSNLKTALEGQISRQGLEIKESSCTHENVKTSLPEVYSSAYYDYRLYSNRKTVTLKLALHATEPGKFSIPSISFEGTNSQEISFNVYQKEALMEDIKHGNIDKIIAFTDGDDQALAYFSSLKIDKQNVLFYLLKNFPDKTSELLRFVTDANMKDDAGTSILSLSVAHQNNELFEYLMQKGADINYIDRKGRTPVMYAAIKGNLYAAERLVGANANLYLSRDGDWTAYKYAKEFKHNKTAQVVKPLYDELIYFTHDCDVCRPKKQKFIEYVKDYKGIEIKYVPVSKVSEYMSNDVKYNPIILAQDSKTGEGRFKEGWNAQEDSLLELLRKE